MSYDTEGLLMKPCLIDIRILWRMILSGLIVIKLCLTKPLYTVVVYVENFKSFKYGLEILSWPYCVCVCVCIYIYIYIFFFFHM
jgi:hypothetical protein